MSFPSPEPNGIDASVPPPDVAAADRTVEPADPHGALFLVLGYLRLPDLFSFQRVCRLFRDAVAGDRLLWRDVVVEPPLSGKLTDDALLKVASRAGGKLRSLVLVDCWKITDAGLQRVVDGNPCITKLYLPGCTYLTADGVVRVVKSLSERKGNLKHLRLRGLCNIMKEHLDILKSLLYKAHPQQDPQPIFYSDWRSVSLYGNGSRPIDIDICPKCNNARLVFDCTRENCRLMKGRWTECKGCFFCIARCEECGGCVDFQEHGEETACSHLLCLGCWLRLPKCNTCNKPYCKRHKTFQAECSGSVGFVCEQCQAMLPGYEYGDWVQ